nr:hypothetical protein CFP56_57848 [Quercus suber]
MAGSSPDATAPPPSNSTPPPAIRPSPATPVPAALPYIIPPLLEPRLLGPTRGFQAINSPTVIARLSIRALLASSPEVHTPLASDAPSTSEGLSTSDGPSTSDGSSTSDRPSTRDGTSTPDDPSAPEDQPECKPPPTTALMRSRIRALRPAPARRTVARYSFGFGRPTCFLDLPAELRIEVYRRALESVQIHILPESSGTPSCPHALIRTSRQVRMEVLPIMHSMCEIRVSITDFNFEPLLTWLARIPPHQEFNLARNNSLSIRLCTSSKPRNIYGDSLRKWLHLRADVFRPQPPWRYSGTLPKSPTANDLKRRVKRMSEHGKRRELIIMLKAIGVIEDRR